MQSDTIDFYNLTNEYGFLSNLWDGTSISKKKQGELFGEYEPFRLEIDGEEWKSVEHYYQAMKFRHHPRKDETSIERDLRVNGEKYISLMKQASSGGKIFQMGNIGHSKRSKWIKSGRDIWRLTRAKDSLIINDIVSEYVDLIKPVDDWDTKKNAIMLKALIWKFKLNSPLREKLLSTGDKQLREFTTRDLYWGTNGQMGENKLGKFLMYVRNIASSGML